MDVQIAIRPRKGMKVKTGQVELVCNEQWWEKETPGDSGSGKLQTHSVLSQPLVQSFIADTEISAAEPVVRYARFQIPKEVPPTVHGSVAQVSWQLSARLEIENGNPITVSQEVTVLTPQVVKAGRSVASLSEEAIFTDCTLALVLVNDVVGAGGFLEGELRAKVNSPQQAKDVRMELHSSESAGEREVESVRERVSLVANLQLNTSDEPYVWAFSLPVPAQTLPTVKSGHTAVSWRLKAVVDTEQTKEAYHLERDVQVFTST
ncbi:MAG: hypothetical protein O3A93_00640 [Chloroflexi bacterium]|nr:hypothetical protein [Chloroflexota bacterium]MDA1269755.1 hypothetical protein [Chloroflexota bacterium]